MTNPTEAKVKEIKDYLHLYLGCEVLIESEMYMFGDKKQKIIDTLISASCYGDIECKNYSPPASDIKLILRPLSDMTEKEAIGWATLRVQPMTVLRVLTITNDGIEFEYESFEKNRIMRVFPDELSPTMFRLLLKNGFDLFDLIKDGIAIDKTKLPAHA